MYAMSVGIMVAVRTALRLVAVTQRIGLACTCIPVRCRVIMLVTCAIFRWKCVRSRS